MLPLFVFTAAGFSLHHFHLRDLAHPAPIALMAGLVLAKPAGVLGACAVGIALRLARRPTGTTWLELAGVACLTGVGFTLSYFIAGMGGPEPPAPIRAAILIGSIAPRAGRRLAAGARAARRFRSSPRKRGRQAFSEILNHEKHERQAQLELSSRRLAKRDVRDLLNAAAGKQSRTAPLRELPG